jgi:predicted transposase YbfD/YdcC
MFGVIEAERTTGGKTPVERRYYIGSTPPNALTLTNAVRAHWGIENRVHGCLDVALKDDQMRARVKNAGVNLAIIRRLVLNLLRLDSSRKGGIHNRRILAASSDNYRAALLGLNDV